MYTPFHTHTSPGIILSLTPSLQNISYISLLTQDKGLIDIKYRIPSKLQHKNSGKLEPFTQGLFQLYMRSTTPTLQEIHQAKNPQLATITPNILYLLSYFVKLTKQLFPKEQNLPLVYKSWNTVLNHIQELEQEKIYLYFLTQLIEQTGVMPNLKICGISQTNLNDNCFFSLSESTLTNQPISELDLKVNLSTRKLIHNLKNLETVKQIKIPNTIYQQSINLLINIIASYIHKSPQTLMPPSELF